MSDKPDVGETSFIGRFDRWVREHYTAMFEGFHEGLWDGWCGALLGHRMPYPGTETASFGATCKRCDAAVNRADERCAACDYVFPSDPDYPIPESKEGS